MDNVNFHSFCESYVARGVGNTTEFLFDDQSYDPDLLYDLCIANIDMSSYACIVEHKLDNRYYYDKYGLYISCLNVIDEEEWNNQPVLVILCFASSS